MADAELFRALAHDGIDEDRVETGEEDGDGELWEGRHTQYGEWCLRQYAA